MYHDQTQRGLEFLPIPLIVPRRGNLGRYSLLRTAKKSYTCRNSFVFITVKGTASLSLFYLATLLIRNVKVLALFRCSFKKGWTALESYGAWELHQPKSCWSQSGHAMQFLMNAFAAAKLNLVLLHISIEHVGSLMRRADSHNWPLPWEERGG